MYAGGSKNEKRADFFCISSIAFLESFFCFFFLMAVIVTSANAGPVNTGNLFCDVN